MKALDELEAQAELNRARREAWAFVALLADLEQELEDLRERTVRHLARHNDSVSDLDRVTRLARKTASNLDRVRRVHKG